MVVLPHLLSARVCVCGCVLLLLLRHLQYLVMLPTGHCGGGAVKWENVSWGLDYATALANAVIDAAAAPVPPPPSSSSPSSSLPWSRLEDVPKMVWYVMGPGGLGSRGNYWTSGDDWPAVTPTVYYLSGSDKLTSEVRQRGQWRWRRL
jgi:hypothetical protein